jgi:hypothetical protein
MMRVDHVEIRFVDFHMVTRPSTGIDLERSVSGRRRSRAAFYSRSAPRSLGALYDRRWCVSPILATRVDALSTQNGITHHLKAYATRTALAAMTPYAASTAG